MVAFGVVGTYSLVLMIPGSEHDVPGQSRINIGVTKNKSPFSRNKE